MYYLYTLLITEELNTQYILWVFLSPLVYLFSNELKLVPLSQYFSKLGTISNNKVAKNDSSLSVQEINPRSYLKGFSSFIPSLRIAYGTSTSPCTTSTMLPILVY